MLAVKPRSRYRILKRFLAVAGAIVIVLFVLRIWFVHNARIVLKQYISEQSGGKIKLELSQLDLNLWSKHLQIHEADLLSTDSLNEPITYHVTFSKLSLTVGSVWALLFKKQLSLDSLKLYDPVIQVMQWRKDTAQVVVKDELSIPQEMGKLYNSLIGALDEFAVRRIIIDNAKISLINKMKPGTDPVTVSNIFFDLARTPSKRGNKKVYLKGDQALELRTTNQNITLPGGRHHLSFKSFNLRLFGERIELDSCTVTAMATDSSKSSYSIFFKKLSLTGVDFTALSAQNVIKADSVYCEDQFFDLNLYRSDAVEKKTETPDPDKIIRELTGNLNLAFVGVKNAGIHLDIYGKTKRSFFNSHKDNFEIQNFRINPDSSQPVTLKRFNMSLRDYRLYNEDSSTTFSFDSLNFLNSRIILSNFGMASKPQRGKVGNDINITIPYFELSQLDWYQLFFEQKMAAKEAILKSPVINFTRRKSGSAGKGASIFTALLNIDSLVGLENVSVQNGQVNMRLGQSASFNVENIDFKIYSNRLLRSTTRQGLQSAVDYLSFSKGVLRLKDLTAQLQNARYTADNVVYADQVSVSSPGNKISAQVNKVFIDNMQLDDAADNLEVDGLRWESAAVNLNAFPTGNKKNKGGSNIHLKNIAGNNTQLNFSSRPASISTFVQTLQASSLLKKGNDLLQAEGFFIAGNDLVVKSNKVNVVAASYKISGSNSSSLTGVRVEQINGRDSLYISSSLVNFSADINELFANDLHLANVHAQAPVIRISKWDTATAAQDTASAQIPVRIDQLTAVEPEITISTHINDSVAVVNIPWSANSLVKASNIYLSNGGMQIDSLLVHTTAATFIKPTGEITGVQNGKIDMDLSDLSFNKKNGKINWSGSVNNLSFENANGFQIGKSKNKLRFQQASLGNLHLSSDLLPDFDQLLKANLSAWLRIPQGEYVDSNTTLQWYNADFTNSTRTLSLDSFHYHPTPPLDSVLAHAPYQLDYITLKTGAIAISGLDVAQYEKDSSFIANTITIQDPVLTVFRDKLPPSSPFKKDKPLPVDMIKNMSLPVSVQSIRLNDGIITYAERNGKSRKQGNLLLTNVSGGLENVTNTNLTTDDSLTLTFNASLMNAADIRLHLKESYTDSLSGFLMTTKMSSADLSVLNPFLVPIANVKIASGILDSVSFKAVGRQDLAFGEMDMHYRKLRIQLVKDGDPEKSTFLQNVLSFIANTFVVKNNNTGRKGTIFYKHLSHQSFFNYIIKTTLSGISSSIGIKKNRKYMKQYKQELKNSRLPPVKS